MPESSSTPEYDLLEDAELYGMVASFLLDGDEIDLANAINRGGIDGTKSVADFLQDCGCDEFNSDAVNQQVYRIFETGAKIRRAEEAAANWQEEELSRAAKIKLGEFRGLANCRGQDSDIFFPAASGEQYSLKARKICQFCPVQEQCLNYALATNQNLGVWGGYSEEERRTLKRRIRDRARNSRQQ